MHKQFYPNSNIEAMPGDVLFTGIGKSTYYVGHAAILGIDGLFKEALPGKPAGHELTIRQLWSRHYPGDNIILMRPDSEIAGRAAAKWATKQLPNVKNYTVINWNFNNIKDNYCFKFIAQAYEFGANHQIIRRPNYRLISPFEFALKNKLAQHIDFKV